MVTPVYPSVCFLLLSMLTQYDELRAARGRTLALEHDTTQELGDYGGRSSLLSKSSAGKSVRQTSVSQFEIISRGIFIGLKW